MRALQRSVVLCLILALSVGLFYIGREHQVFLDNKTIEVDGQSFRALKFVKITVRTQAGDAPTIELMPRDRDLAKVTGPSFQIKVEVMDEFGEKVEKVIEKDLTPGFSKDLMLSMPLLAADRDDYILPPPAVQAPSSERDTEPSEETLALPTEPVPDP
ncbi:MAG: hypothetical protein LBQ42_13885 [Synergistaceae bacterium]|jgi:hypothetical protein|nr:hypothetical protein [Synergistaceae bacterium]